MAASIRIILLGRNPIALEGLDRVLRDHDFSISAKLSDPDEVAAAVTLHPDDCNLIVVDGMAGNDGTLTARLLVASPQARVVLLDDGFDMPAMKAHFTQGGYGYIVKTIASRSLIGLLHLVADGEKVVPGELIGELPNWPAPGEGGETAPFIEAAGLSNREVQILTCLVAGHPNKIISRELGISEATVKVHVKAILRKIGVQNRTQAAIWALGERGNGPAASDANGAHPVQPRMCMPLQ